jgi:CheY-like chemotaxis protein
VLTAATGAEALRAAAAGQPDLILLDVMRPDSDGFEVIRGIRGGKPHIPVIFLTRPRQPARPGCRAQLHRRQQHHRVLHLHPAPQARQ